MYLKYEIWGRGNLYKSWLLPQWRDKIQLFFFSWELVTRTCHVSARMCFGSLRLKLTDQIHGVSCTCRGRDRCTSALHDAEFVCLASKLSPSALDWERQDFLRVQNKGCVVWERSDNVAINVSICCQYKMIVCVPISSFSSPNTGKTRTKWSEFSEGPPRSSGAGALALCGEAEGSGLNKSGEELAPGDPRAAPYCLQGGCWGDSPQWCMVGGWGTSRHSLKQGMFTLGKMRNFVSMRTVKPGSRLLREIVQLEVIQIVFDCSLLKHTNNL